MRPALCLSYEISILERKYCSIIRRVILYLPPRHKLCFAAHAGDSCWRYRYLYHSTNGSITTCENRQLPVRCTAIFALFFEISPEAQKKTLSTGPLHFFRRSYSAVLFRLDQSLIAYDTTCSPALRPVPLVCHPPCCRPAGPPPHKKISAAIVQPPPCCPFVGPTRQKRI